MTARLSGRQIQQIHAALLSAFSSRDDLRLMVRVQLDADLNAIVAGGSLRLVAFSLLDWAERNGRIDDLIEGACNQVPGNPKLRQLLQELYSWEAGKEMTSTPNQAQAGTGVTSLTSEISPRDRKSLKERLLPTRQLGPHITTSNIRNAEKDASIQSRSVRWLIGLPTLMVLTTMMTLFALPSLGASDTSRTATPTPAAIEAEAGLGAEPEPRETATAIPTRPADEAPSAATPEPSRSPTQTSTVSPTVTSTPTEPPPTIASPWRPLSPCPDRSSDIQVPAYNATVSGELTIEGTATHDYFEYYKLEYTPGADLEHSKYGWPEDSRNYEQVVDDVLGRIDTSKLPEGPNTLRLTVVKEDGNHGATPCTIPIVVRNQTTYGLQK